MTKRPENKKAGSGRRALLAAVGIALVLMMLISGVWLASRIFPAAFLPVSRVKNAFSYYVLKQKPHFYYLEMEKNGRTVRLGEKDTLYVTYRDEFVLKAVISDDLAGRYTSATVEGTGSAGNHLGVLLRGLDLVNQVMYSESAAKGAKAAGSFRIRVDHAKQRIAVVPISVVIEPQDWLRVAAEAGSAVAQVDYLKNAAVRNPQDIGVRRILAAVYLRQNRTEEAVALYKEILRIRPDDAGAMKELARGYLQANRSEQALDILQKLAGVESRDAEVFSLLGLAYGRQNRWNQSVQAYARAVLLEPDHTERRWLWARALEKAGQSGAAAEQYQYLLARAKDPTLALRALGEMALQQKKYDEAISHYSRILGINPKDALAHVHLAAAFAGQGKSKEEMAHLQKATALAPDDPFIRLNLAGAYEKRGRSDEAVKAYQSAFQKNPDDPVVLERMADQMMKSKQYDRAIVFLEKLALIYPQRASIFLHLGFAHGELKQYGKSAESYEKAVKLGVRDQALYYNLAYTYTKLGQDRQAVAYYEKISPPTRQSLGFIADYYLKTRKYEKAISFYQQVVKLDPKRASSYFSVGYAYAASQNWDKAIANYQAALKYDREDAETYASLGEAYEKKSLYAEALKAYKTAYELNPETRVGGRIPKLSILLMQKKD